MGPKTLQTKAHPVRSVTRIVKERKRELRNGTQNKGEAGHVWNSICTVGPMCLDLNPGGELNCEEKG